MRRLLLVLAVLAFAEPALSRDDPAPEDGRGSEGTEAGPSRPEGSTRLPEPQDDSRDDGGGFTPSERIGAETTVPFPADI